MLDRTQAHADLKQSNPNSTLESDWDVIAEIWSTILAGSFADTLLLEVWVGFPQTSEWGLVGRGITAHDLVHTVEVTGY